MRKSIQNILFLICLGLASCTGLSHLPKGEKLYTGAEVKFELFNNVNTKFIKITAEEAVRPKPNKSILGMRPKLWLYMLPGESPKGKLGKWLKKTGEAPVLLSSVKPGVTSAIIDARLFNIGIFKSFTESEIIENKHTARIIYTSHIHKPFVVKELICAVSDDSLARLIIQSNNESFIKPGQDYNLVTLKNERLRLDALAKDHGYFYFNSDYLMFKADTSEVNHNVILKLTLKDTIPKNALTVYRIRKVMIDQDYSLNDEVSTFKRDTLIFQNTVFLSGESAMEVSPKEILRSDYFRKNEIFSRKNHIITLNRLMSLDNFKFVRIKFADSDTTASGFLDVTILMTPMPKRTFRTELDLVSKSDNNAGPRLNLSLLTRNVFKGTELLSFNMAGSFEAQLSGANNKAWSYSWNPKVELTFPRFIIPFNLKKSGSIYFPKTNISLSYNYLKRVNYFDMQTFQFQYGYKWKENIRKEHELNPVSVSFSTIRNKSIAFTELLNSNQFLKKSYEEQFIAGGNYSYTYNEQVMVGKKMQYYFHLTTELAGNAFSLAKLISGEKISSENPSTIVGSVYSQFAKFSLDGRGYYNFKDNNKLAFRVFAGFAKAFGNSSILPYSKQFFSGGPNSLRAFQINSVGPGTYYQDPHNSGFLQLGGDLKLEMNSEYRFTIYKYFKGAFFVDSGNIWLLKSNPENIGTPFAFSRFPDELAVGTGFGFRVDLSFFVLRFDLAMPLRKPWLEENHRWVIDEIDLRSSAWRKDNLILNVAIGYPF